MLSFYTLIVAIAMAAELVNAVWMYLRKSLKTVNVIAAVIFLAVGGISFLGWAQHFFWWVFFAGLIIWHGLGFLTQNYGNPLNHNRVGSVLLGMYLAISFVFLLIQPPCSDPHCNIHHPYCSVEDIQQFIR